MRTLLTPTNSGLYPSDRINSKHPTHQDNQQREIFFGSFISGKWCNKQELYIYFFLISNRSAS